MKAGTLLTLLSAMGVSCVAGQGFSPTPTLGPLPFVTLDAVTSGSHAEQQSQWESGYGSYDRSTFTNSKVDITVRNGGQTRCSIMVITVFIAHPLNGGDATRTVCGLDHKVADLDPSRDLKFLVNSPETTLRDQNYAAIGQRDVAGTKTEGWIVAVLDKATNKMLQVKASSSSLESLGSDRQRLAQMLTDYERVHAPNAVGKRDVAEGQPCAVYGPVLSVRGGNVPGVLVGCRNGGSNQPPRAFGTVFLEYHPDQNRLAPGVVVDCMTKRERSYIYTDEAGQKRTVPVFDYVSGH